jgi:uncharacterized Tic20 family protein
MSSYSPNEFKYPSGTGDDRSANMWALVCHLSGFAGLFYPVVGNVIPPLVIWLVKKNEFPFVESEGKEAINFQLSIAIYNIILFAIAIMSGILFAGSNGTLDTLLSLIGVCVLLIIALFIFMVIEMIIAASKASNGEHHVYPLRITFIR